MKYNFRYANNNLNEALIERNVYRDKYRNETMLNRKLEFEERKIKTERQEKIRGLGGARGTRGKPNFRGKF